MTEPADLPRILLVDDEPNVLDGLRRQLRREFRVETAVGAAIGLFKLGQDEPFEVIVSDYLMPGINGAEFLAAARRAAPSSTRMLLTGHTDLADAAITVNRGQVYRMLLKPVDQETMSAALRDCVSQHRLVVAERELLEQTLHGSVTALMDVLSLACPNAFGRATRMRRLASVMLDVLEFDAEDRWAVEMAVTMSQLGVVSLPPSVSEKLDTGVDLSAVEQAMVAHLPTVSGQLIRGIPRLSPVAEAIRYSPKGYDGSGTPDDSVAGDDIPFGARLLRVVLDHDLLISSGLSAVVAVATLTASSQYYDPALLEALSTAVDLAEAEPIRGVMLAHLQPGMVLARSVTSLTRVRLVDAGQEVTVSLIARLHNFADLDDGVAEPIMVYGNGATLTEVDDSVLAATS
jgi:response regulator RpfG family c-di-GMP phosphodiesterase